MKHQRSQGAGMTLTELMLGLSVTALVIAAATALLQATTDAWARGSTAYEQSNSLPVAMERATRLVRECRMIGFTELPDSVNKHSSLLLWERDDNEDGVIQAGELTLLYWSGQTSADLDLYAASYDDATPVTRHDFFNDDTATQYVVTNRTAVPLVNEPSKVELSSMPPISYSGRPYAYLTIVGADGVESRTTAASVKLPLEPSDP